LVGKPGRFAGEEERKNDEAGDQRRISRHVAAIGKLGDGDRTKIRQPGGYNAADRRRTIHPAGILPALAWTVIFAIALWPLFQRVAARWPRHQRELLPSLFVLAVVLVFVIPVILIAVPLAADAHAARQWLEQVQQSGLPPPQFLGHLPGGNQLTSLWQQKLSQPSQISVLTKGAIQGGGAKAATTFGRETLHRLVLFGFMLLGLFFFLWDGEDVIKQLRVGSRRAFGAAGEDIGGQIIKSVHGTVNGLVLVGLGEGLLLGLGYLVTGVPHPTLFGMITAILAMVPFGAAIAIFVEAPMASPRTSRRPSALTPVAMVTATEMMRPASRTLR
jgi:predicted PurR-regulated permease PerM